MYKQKMRLRDSMYISKFCILLPGKSSARGRRVSIYRTIRAYPNMRCMATNNNAYIKFRIYLYVLDCATVFIENLSQNKTLFFSVNSCT